MQQRFAPTFSACLSICAGTSGCEAASFDASQSQGFNNCYLKSTSDPPTAVIQIVATIDTGIMISGPNVSDSTTSTSASTVAASSVSSSVSLSTITVVTVAAATPSTMSESSVMATAADVSLTASPVVSSAATSVTGDSTLIAGLVCGSVGALAVVVGLFVWISKKRQRRRARRPEGSKSYWPDPPTPRSMKGRKLFFDWPPLPKRKELKTPGQRPREVVGTMADMGNRTVVSSRLGKRLDFDEKDLGDGRIESWKKGTAPRISLLGIGGEGLIRSNTGVSEKENEEQVLGKFKFGLGGE